MVESGSGRARDGDAEAEVGGAAHSHRRSVPSIDALSDSVWAEAGLSTEWLAAIFDHVGFPIFVKDRAFRFVVLNRAFADLVGFPRASMLGKVDHDFFPREQADFFRQKDIEMFATGSQIVIDEEPITDAAGQRHVLATTKVPLRNAAGEATFLVGIVHDITRLKDSEDALRRANEDLDQRVQERSRDLARAQDDLLRKERLAVLGKLAGGVAHQIRNPLGSIKNAAYLLEKEVGAGTGAAREALAVIHDEVERANRIITDLLDYARVRTAVRRPIPLGYLVEQALCVQAWPPHVHIVRDLADQLSVIVDADQVPGAICNVVRNAVEAMPDGGTVTLGTRMEGGFVVLMVTDTGPGVAAEVTSRMFDPLVTTKQLGLGLGLVTARLLVENQGGVLRYAGHSDGGTRFEIALPAA